MSITISSYPENYSSPFKSVSYTLECSDTESDAIEIETINADSDSTLGIKRFAISNEITIDTSCYIRRLFNPVPVKNDICKFITATGRTARTFIRNGQTVSNIITSLPSLHTITPFVLLSPYNTIREIRPYEWDEISFLALPCNLTASIDIVCNEDNNDNISFSPDPIKITQDSSVTLVINTNDILAHVTDKKNAIGCKINIFADGSLKITVDYVFESYLRNSLRICWLNDSGAFDYYTFKQICKKNIQSNKERILTLNGYTTTNCTMEEYFEMTCEELPKNTMEYFSKVIGSPKVFIIEDGETFEADVITDDLTLFSTTKNGAKIKLRKSKTTDTQKF